MFCGFFLRRRSISNKMYFKLIKIFSFELGIKISLRKVNSDDPALVLNGFVWKRTEDNIININVVVQRFATDKRIQEMFGICRASGRNVLGNISTFPTSINGDRLTPLIVGGTEAEAGEFRGKISIQFANGTHICGGTLIHASHVLTSASCMTTSEGEVIHPSTYRLIGDDLSISVQSSNQNRQVREVTHVFVHPEYNLHNFDHNVAVIRTNESFLASSTFNTVSRPLDSPPPNTQCSVAGWGNIFHNGPISFQLRRINATVISRALCNSEDSYGGAVRGGMFCAGDMNGGQDTCQGDGGGGLICDNMVFGIVSWGVECALPNFPGVYTDVAIYNTWISSTIDWVGGEHEDIPTPPPSTTYEPTPTTSPTSTTLSPGGATGIISSIYLFFVCITIALFK
ncbi:Trypsin-1 [Pseudolycoriella hygida]|uniref:Trypsin-1 n=1 Tax=Pseudolycoriella hygida TaxID=35572 RepID=A0A9Q0MPY1_9DIPT|nr:Trypsin-1 [Pseudolycoriella hygida]